MKISQSLIKDWLAYKRREVCGSVIKSRWIDKTWVREWQDSETMALGRYFEFLINGERPSGYKSDPEPKKYKTKDQLLAPYELAHKKADQVKELMKNTGLEIVSGQKYFERDDLEGTCDLICDFKGEMVVVDIKYSGLIDDRWSKFGWNWSDEQKIEHGIQAKQYAYITGYDFYFLVVSSGKDKEVRLFKPIITPEMLENHKNLAYQTRKELTEAHMTGSLVDYPSHGRCGSCPIRKNCDNRAEKLQIEQVEIF